MDNLAKTHVKASLSDYLAAERTLLAWIRTGLALMGFGFVVARFGLFLQEFQAIQHAVPLQPTGLSLWFGTALIAVGVLVNAFAGWHYSRLVEHLNKGETSFSHASTQAVAIALFLAIVGLAMVIYLVSIRHSIPSPSANKKESSMLQSPDQGIVKVQSHHSVDGTVEKIKEMLKAKGVNLFALVDHSGEAEKVGMKMPPTKLLIFGNPKAGTPLMLAAPSSALDLPLKILVAEDNDRKVWVTYNSPAYLQERHGIPKDLIEKIGVAGTLAATAAE